LSCVDKLLLFYKGVSHFHPGFRRINLRWGGSPIIESGPLDVDHLSAENFIGLIKNLDDHFVDKDENHTLFDRGCYRIFGFLIFAFTDSGAPGDGFYIKAKMGSYSEFGPDNIVDIEMPSALPFGSDAPELARKIMNVAWTVFDPRVMTFGNVAHFDRCVDPETLTYAGPLTYVKGGMGGIDVSPSTAEPFGAGTLVELSEGVGDHGELSCGESRRVANILAASGFI